MPTTPSSSPPQSHGHVGASVSPRLPMVTEFQEPSTFGFAPVAMLGGGESARDVKPSAATANISPRNRIAIPFQVLIPTPGGCTRPDLVTGGVRVPAYRADGSDGKRELRSGLTPPMVDRSWLNHHGHRRAGPCGQRGQGTRAATREHALYLGNRVGLPHRSHRPDGPRGPLRTDRPKSKRLSAGWRKRRPRLELLSIRCGSAEKALARPFGLLSCVQPGRQPASVKRESLQRALLYWGTRMNLKHALLAAAVVGLATPLAQAGLTAGLYGSDRSGTLFLINTTNASTTTIGGSVSNSGFTTEPTLRPGGPHRAGWSPPKH